MFNWSDDALKELNWTQDVRTSVEDSIAGQLTTLSKEYSIERTFTLKTQHEIHSPILTAALADVKQDLEQLRKEIDSSLMYADQEQRIRGALEVLAKWKWILEKCVGTMSFWSDSIRQAICHTIPLSPDLEVTDVEIGGVAAIKKARK